MFIHQQILDLLGSPHRVRFALLEQQGEHLGWGLMAAAMWPTRYISQSFGAMGRITTQPLVARLSANIEVFAELRDAEAAGGR